jgi:hypothetical protein
LTLSTGLKYKAFSGFVKHRRKSMSIKKTAAKDTKKVVVKAGKAPKAKSPKKVSKGKAPKAKSPKKSQKANPGLEKVVRVEILTGTPLEKTLKEPMSNLKDPIWQGKNFKLRGVEWVYGPSKEWICVNEVGPFMVIRVLPKDLQKEGPFEVQASLLVFDKTLQATIRGFSPNLAITQAIRLLKSIVSKYVSLKLEDLALSLDWNPAKESKGSKVRPVKALKK